MSPITKKQACPFCGNPIEVKTDRSSSPRRSIATCKKCGKKSTPDPVNPLSVEK